MPTPNLLARRGERRKKQPFAQPRKSMVIIIRGVLIKCLLTRSAEALAGMTYSVRRSLVTAQAMWSGGNCVSLPCYLCPERARTPGKSASSWVANFELLYAHSQPLFPSRDWLLDSAVRYVYGILFHAKPRCEHPKFSNLTAWGISVVYVEND